MPLSRPFRVARQRPNGRPLKQLAADSAAGKRTVVHVDVEIRRDRPQPGQHRRVLTGDTARRRKCPGNPRGSRCRQGDADWPGGHAGIPFVNMRKGRRSDQSRENGETDLAGGLQHDAGHALPVGISGRRLVRPREHRRGLNGLRRSAAGAGHSQSNSQNTCAHAEPRWIISRAVAPSPAPDKVINIRARRAYSAPFVLAGDSRAVMRRWVWQNAPVLTMFALVRSPGFRAPDLRRPELMTSRPEDPAA